MSVNVRGVLNFAMEEPPGGRLFRTGVAVGFTVTA